MMKKEEKDKYEAPLTRRTQVDLENGFMKASIVDKEDNKDNPVDAGDQEIEGEFDFTSQNPWQ